LSGLGIDAQRATVIAYADRKGLSIVEEFCDEGVSAKSLKGRPAALAALEAVRTGKAGGLLVAKMDRLSRSVVDGASLMEQAAREGWKLHFADLDIDTSTPAGVRVSRLAEAVQIINALFRGEQVSFAGTHYTITRGPGLGVLPGRPNNVTFPHRLIQSCVDTGQVRRQIRTCARRRHQRSTEIDRKGSDTWIRKPASDSSSSAPGVAPRSWSPSCCSGG
jgi:hypothetical protein